jgi:DTW domain-containing protein
VRCSRLVNAAPPRAIRSQRLAQCQGCGLPVVACICAALPTIATRTRVVVVMHRREAFRTSNTGRLAVKILPRAACAVRGGKEPRPAPGDLPGKRLVLFPQEGARVLAPSDASDDTVLIVPDGTWSQAQRVLRREPCARGAEVVRLPPCRPTRYSLRRNTREGALCTFEAIAAALQLLEGGDVEARMLASFEAFLGRAHEVRGRRNMIGALTPP